MAVLRPVAVACPVSHLIQDGTSETDVFAGGAMDPNGSCVLAGRSGSASASRRHEIGFS